MPRKCFVSLLVLTGVLAAATVTPMRALDRDAPPALSDERPGVAGEGLEGAWLGELWAPAGKLRILLKLFEKDGEISGSLDSLDEHIGGLQLHSVLHFGTEVQFELTRPRAKFRGRMDPTGAEILGRWKQDGAKSWLVLRRLDGKPANP